VRMGPCLAADRYSLLPMMGLVVSGAACLYVLVRPGHGWWPRLVRGGLVCVVLATGVVLVLRTREQCRTWRTSGTLWSHALAVSTEPNPFACRGLGKFLAADPRTRAAAESLLTRAVRMVPDDPDLANDLGLLLVEQGRPEEGLPYFRNALRLEPDHVYARINLGNLLAARGDLAGAMAAYRAALQIAPANSDAHANLGMALLLKDRLPEAEPHLVEALRLDPGAVQARRALEDLRRRRGPHQSR
jgi:tetratricopeptide (TPR) repeat protein